MATNKIITIKKVYSKTVELVYQAVKDSKNVIAWNEDIFNKEVLSEAIDNEYLDFIALDNNEESIFKIAVNIINNITSIQNF